MGIQIPGYSLLLIKRCMTYCKNSYSGESAFQGGEMKFVGTQHGVCIPIFFEYEYNNDLYFIVRGTSDDVDFATDCAYSEELVNFGKYQIYCHGGFYKSAKYIYDIVKPHIDAFKGRNIYFVGHSMGGSISTILGLMFLSDPLYADKQMGIICVAPAPSVSEFPEEYNEKLINIVNEHDLIPEFSVISIYNMIGMIVPKTPDTKPAVKAVLLIILDIIKGLKSDFSDNIFKALSDGLPIIIDDIYAYKNDKSHLHVGTLHGHTYKLVKNGPTTLSQNEIDPTTLDMMVIWPDSINNHLPKTYEETIGRLEEL